jgi:uncharacterized membrane protein YqaE (UPF0057 family)
MDFYFLISGVGIRVAGRILGFFPSQLHAFFAIFSAFLFLVLHYR